MKKNLCHLSKELLVVFGSALCLLLTGCASSLGVNYAPIDELKEASAAQQQEPYKIGAGDELEIKFLAVPELSDKQIVAPDGTISLMFAPHIEASGLTVAELTQNLKKALAAHVKQADMVIIVRSFASQKAFVNGEVSKPGPVLLNGPETIMQVLGEAGWMAPTAGADQVVLMRRGSEETAQETDSEEASKTGEETGKAASDETGKVNEAADKEKVYRIDVSKLIDGSDMSQNILVQAGDIILVPPSGAVAADRWVDQHIRQMLPLSSSMSYNINAAPNTITH